MAKERYQKPTYEMVDLVNEIFTEFSPEYSDKDPLGENTKNTENTGDGGAKKAPARLSYGFSDETNKEEKYGFSDENESKENDSLNDQQETTEGEDSTSQLKDALNEIIGDISEAINNIESPENIEGVSNPDYTEGIDNTNIGETNIDNDEASQDGF